MKKTLTLIAMVAIAMLVATAGFAQPGSVPGTLYQQEGTTADGPAGIDNQVVKPRLIDPDDQSLTGN